MTTGDEGAAAAEPKAVSGDEGAAVAELKAHETAPVVRINKWEMEVDARMRSRCDRCGRKYRLAQRSPREVGVCGRQENKPPP